MLLKLGPIVQPRTLNIQSLKNYITTNALTGLFYDFKKILIIKLYKFEF